MEHCGKLLSDLLKLLRGCDQSYGLVLFFLFSGQDPGDCLEALLPWVRALQSFKAVALLSSLCHGHCHHLHCVGKGSLASLWSPFSADGFVHLHYLYPSTMYPHTQSAVNRPLGKEPRPFC